MRRWQNVLAIIPAVLILLYLMAGFFVVPRMIHYAIEQHLSGVIGRPVAVRAVAVNPLLLSLRLWDFQLGEEDGGLLISLEKLVVDISWSSLGKKAVVFDRVGLEKPIVKLVVSAEGTSNLSELGGSHVAPETEESSSARGVPVKIASAWVNRGTVILREHSRSPGFQHVFRPIDLHVSNVSTQMGEPAAFYLECDLGDTGKAAVQAVFSADPLQADATVLLTEIPLPLFASYLRSALPLRIASGKLSAYGSISYTLADSVHLKSDVRAAEVSVVDPEGSTELFGWGDLFLEEISVAPASQQVSVGAMVLDGLRAAVTVEPDGRVNIARILAAAGSARPLPSEDAEPRFAETDSSGLPPLSIGSVRLQAGTVLFRDESVQPQLRTRIENISATISGIAPDPASMINAEVEATVSPGGKFQLQARLLPFTADPTADITASLEGFELITASPYFGKYVGFAVDRGDFSAALAYQITPRQLIATNHLITQQLTLGQRVESPDALKIPIKLALSLLEDRNQRIDLALPLEGDPRNPEFRIGMIVTRAFVNTLTKLVTSPFSFLSSLVGGTQGDLNIVMFAAGAATLSEAETEKVKMLATALVQRPRLVLEIQGAVHPEYDRRALQEAAFDAELRARYPDSAKDPTPYIYHMFKQRLGGRLFRRVRRDVKRRSRAAGARFDEKDVAAELRRRIIAAQPVAADALQILAQNRAAAIAAILTALPEAESSRIMTRPVATNATREGEYIKNELFLTVE